MATRTFIIFVITVFSMVQADAQIYNVRTYDSIYAVENRLISGDKQALFDIAPYLDSTTTPVTESLGYHILHTTHAEIARRIIKENCLFTEGEITITSRTSATEFSAFLNANKDKIAFSEHADAFLLTPLGGRKVHYEVRELSETRKTMLNDSGPKLLKADWVKLRKIDSLVRDRNPACLLAIAAELFKYRERFDRYCFYKGEFTSLLEYLTSTTIGVENDKHEISWHVDKDYDYTTQLNLLIYFSQYYWQYKWDANQNIFVNPYGTPRTIGKEEKLFELLANENDTVALNAFIQLSVCNPQTVNELADEYEKAGIDRNYALPIFPYKFLKQLSVLTTYCKARNIDYTGSASLQSNMAKLRTNLKLAQRYKLENELINSLTLDDITAFEYWGLIYESWYYNTYEYSLGRVLDIFYSRNWNKLLASDKYLECYLKKCALFNRLGIIGTCNNYRLKFYGCNESMLDTLWKYSAINPDFSHELTAISLLNNTAKEQPAWMKDYEKVVVGIRVDISARYAKAKPKGSHTIALVRAGIDYQNADGSLNYDKIYELLKFDVVMAFVGGGGGLENYEMPGLISMLQSTFKTSLGFPHKLCPLPSMYSCDQDERAEAWMRFLEDKHLLKSEHKEPRSFRN